MKKGKTNMEFTAESFDFDNIVQEIGTDPFAKTSDKYAEDLRFYKLAKDKDGNGAAIIRFLPDKHKNLIKTVNKINTTIEKNGKKRFVNELSPQTIGLPCPFQEEWQRLWNLGEKEASKKFGRSIRYYTNIKVIKDPANPANEGKIFLLDMSGTLKDKIEKLLNPPQADKDLGTEAKQLFNPLKGNSFKLSVKNGSNGIPSFESSSALEVVNSIYDTVEACITDIKENTHDLSEFDKPETFMTYEKLQDKLKWVTFADSANVQTITEVAPAVSPVQELNANVVTQTVTEKSEASSTAQPTQESKSQSLDDLLEGLM